jgi:hypothetical protein
MLSGMRKSASVALAGVPNVPIPADDACVSYFDRKNES